MKRFLAVFMAAVVCFSLIFYVPVNRVSADELILGSSFSSRYSSVSSLSFVGDIPLDPHDSVVFTEDFRIQTFDRNNNIVNSIYIACDSISTSSVDSDGNLIVDLGPGHYWFNSYCFRFVSGKLRVGFYDSTFPRIYGDFFYDDQNSRSFSVYHNSNNRYIYDLSLLNSLKKSNDLSFTVSPDLSENMNLNDIGGNVTVTVENASDKAYDYMIWVSKNPSDIGVVNSLYAATYITSSTQWCYTKQSDASIPPDKVQLVKDKITDEFNTTDILDIVSGAGFVGYNVWGGMFEAAKEYMSYNDDHVTYYSKTQSNCPVYLVNPGGAKQHQIPFSAFNITLNDTYYFNISYKEHSSNVVSSVGASAAALLGAAGGEYDAPIFNTSDFTSYQSYTSIPFSVGSGYTSVNQSDDITGYNILTYYSNPNNSVANITNDNSVHINDSYNTNNPGGSGSGGSGGFVGGASGIVVNGVLVNGTANFSPGLTLQPGIGGGSGSGGSGVSAPSAPDFDFDIMKDGMGSFMDFLSWVGEHVPPVIVYLFSAGLAVAVYCRIFGR